MLGDAEPGLLDGAPGELVGVRGGGPGRGVGDPRDGRGVVAGEGAAVPAVRPGAFWKLQYAFVWAMTWAGGGAPCCVRSSVVCASATSVVS